MSSYQESPDNMSTLASTFTIQSGSIGLAHVVAHLLQYHGFQDHPDAAIRIILDSPHRFALTTLETAKLPGRRDARFIAVSSSACPEYLEDLWDLGLAGLLASGGNLDHDLPDLVRRAARGERWRISSVPPTTLTACERRVLRLLADGLDNKHIAVKLQRTHQNVKNIIASIFAKIGVSNRVEAALHYWSLLPPIVQEHEIGE